MADDGGGWTKPSWWSDLVAFVTGFSKFIEDPPRYIVALFVGGLLYIVNTISDTLASALSAFAAPADAINTGLMTLGQLVGDGIIGVVGSVNRVAINIALGTGPLAPVGVFLLWLAEMWVVYRLIMIALPVVGGLLSGVLGGGR